MTQLISISREASLTSRDICKESKNPSVTKTYSVGFKHDAELQSKQECQKTKPFWIKESNNLNDRENFGAKILVPDSWTAWNNWIDLLFDAYPYAKNQHQMINSVLTYWRLTVRNYHWQAKVCLTKIIWVDWII